MPGRASVSPPASRTRAPLARAATDAPGTWHTAFEYYRAWFDDVRQNEAHAATPLEMPVLAIGGAYSSGPFPELSLREVANDVTGCIIERCGH